MSSMSRLNSKSSSRSKPRLRLRSRCVTYLRVYSLLFSMLHMVEIASSVQFYSQAIPVPAVGASAWRFRDGFQFQVQNPADGTYHFGYDTGTGKDESYREERRNVLGQVFGRYGYVDPNGILRTVEYYADRNGFRSHQTDLAPLDNPQIQIIGPIPKPFVYQQPYHHPLTHHLPLNINLNHPLMSHPPPVAPLAPSPPPPPAPIPLPVSPPTPTARKFRNEKIKAASNPN